MAINVIKHGEKKFKKICPKCGCEFEYEFEDLEKSFDGYFNIKCPDCDHYIKHSFEEEPIIPDISWGPGIRGIHTGDRFEQGYDPKRNVSTCEDCPYHKAGSLNLCFNPCDRCPNNKGIKTEFTVVRN